jgi:hypothetical protein
VPPSLAKKLGPIDRASPYLHTMDNAQKVNNCINTPPSLSFKSYLQAMHTNNYQRLLITDYKHTRNSGYTFFSLTVKKHSQ